MHKNGGGIGLGLQKTGFIDIKTAWDSRYIHYLESHTGSVEGFAVAWLYNKVHIGRGNRGIGLGSQKTGFIGLKTGWGSK